ncbi:unnamed protein product [Clonostachys rosea]|uniref:Uncharacterized protein n=1 Tax=Bionectria ochroleuca TaxID=29856 RepID=A0ABY6U3Q0_BIOOC|nr:unnamed protein product [Clonostachys rosea]
MVGVQQVFIPAVLIGLAAAAPLAPQPDVAVRDVNELADLDLAARDLVLDLGERDFEDFDLVLRSLYGDEMDLETRANLFSAVKAVAPALKNIKNVLPGSKKLVGAVSGAVKAKNAVAGAAKTVGKTVVNNKGKTYDRLLKTADTSMNVAKTVKTNQKPAQGKRDEWELEERDDEWDLEERDDEWDLEERDDEWDLEERDGEFDLEERAVLFNTIKAAVKAKNAITGAAKTVAKTVVNNKGKTYDRLLKTADTSMKVAQTSKSKRAEEHDSSSEHHTKKGKKASRNSKKVASKRKNRVAKKAKKHSEEN